MVRDQAVLLVVFLGHFLTNLHVPTAAKEKWSALLNHNERDFACVGVFALY